MYQQKYFDLIIKNHLKLVIMVSLPNFQYLFAKGVVINMKSLT
jgi:hypothetical protein